MMYDFYHLNEKSLSSSIRTKRDLIIELLLAGATVEDAFSQAASSLAEKK